MNSQELRSLLLKLNNYLINSLDGATGLGIKQSHYEISIAHLLIILIEDGRGDVPLILNHFNIDQGKVQNSAIKALEDLKTGNSGKPVLSPLLTDLLEQAWITSSVRLSESKIRSGALFAVFCASGSSVSMGLSDVLSPVNQEHLLKNFYRIVAGSIEGDQTPAESLPAEDARLIPQEGSVLDLYTTNLTASAKDKKLDPILGRDDEILQMIEILSKRKKSNPILLGEPGVGKTAVVEGLAQKIAADEVPQDLKGVQIHSLDLGALQAGTKMRGEFEKRLKAVINEVVNSSHRIILFIDEAHTLIGAGGAAGSGDAANLLKPALARGEFRAIAATTYLEYNKYFAKDAALERRFQIININEPEDEKAVLMLRGLKRVYETHHGIHISDEALEAAVKLSRRYVAGRQLPDIAIDLLDTAATRIKMSLTSRPHALELLVSELNSVKLKLASLQKDREIALDIAEELLQELQDKKTLLEAQIEANTERWEKERQLTEKLLAARKEKNTQATDAIDQKMAALKTDLKALQGEHPQVFSEVTRQTIAEIIESWTGIPAGNMKRDEMTTLMNLEEDIKKRVVGQDHAISEIADVIRGAKVGLKKEEGPIGVFLLVGPSGVGKTELARAVAEVLFGEERFMITLNMTEYQNQSNTSRLIGSDPGLIGYGEGGALSEPVRRRPYSVVLLDEIEKAHSAVIDIFMQVFDRGMLQDAERRHIDFSNTVIFMTSNLGSEHILKKYHEGVTAPEKLLDYIRPYWINPRNENSFRPEFLGRVKPIVFLPLPDKVMKLIINMKLNKLIKRLKENQKLEVTIDKSVVEHIAMACNVVETGARMIDAIIDRQVAPDISRQLLSFMAEDKIPATLKIGKKKNGEFDYKFK